MPKFFQFALNDDDASKLEALIGSEKKQEFFEKLVKELLEKRGVRK